MQILAEQVVLHIGKELTEPGESSEKKTTFQYRVLY